MQQFFCELHDGTMLECKSFGPSNPEAPTLVFLHEGIGCVDLWKNFPQQLSQATGLRSICYSRAGYGRSSSVSWPRPVTYMHKEALAVLPEILEKLEITDAILFGHSDGASISLIHAGGCPGSSVRAMIIEAPHVVIEELTVRSIGDLSEQYERGDLRARLERYHGANVDCAFHGFVDTWLVPANAASWSILDFVAHVQIPTLVLQGSDDQFGTSRQLELIKKTMPGSVNTVVIPECGHHPHFESQQFVLERSQRFVEEVLGRLLPSP
jgi:pimeloyl-ACP methyl ester carboxylesterase